MTLVAIHQPTFLPWLGWWDKLARCDVFVLLDDVQFPKKGGTWMNRTRIRAGEGWAWLTVPVERSHHGVRNVRGVFVDDSTAWRPKLVKTLTVTYGRAEYFGAVEPLLGRLLPPAGSNVADANERSIRLLAPLMGFDAGKLVRQSVVGRASTAGGTDLLVELTRLVGGSAYLTGDGADGYLEPDKFAAAGLELVEQRFDHPRYPQGAPEFVPGLSVVDAAMNVGWDGVQALL